MSIAQTGSRPGPRWPDGNRPGRARQARARSALAAALVLALSGCGGEDPYRATATDALRAGHDAVRAGNAAVDAADRAIRVGNGWKRRYYRLRTKYINDTGHRPY